MDTKIAFWEVSMDYLRGDKNPLMVLSLILAFFLHLFLFTLHFPSNPPPEPPKIDFPVYFPIRTVTITPPPKEHTQPIIQKTETHKAIPVPVPENPVTEELSIDFHVASVDPTAFAKQAMNQMDEIPPPPPIPQQPEWVNNISILAPKILHRVNPRYPKLALQAGYEGYVIVRLTLDIYGDIADMEVLKPAPYGCTQAALQALKLWKFEPAREASTGRPVPAYYNVTVIFQKEEP